jgi:hypothetical protein
MLTTKQKILIGSFSRSPNPSSPLSPPHFVPFYVYVFPDPAEKSGAFQLTLRSRDLTLFLELHGPFNVLTESSIPQTYVNSHSHHFKTAPPTADEFNDDYYSFSALRACAISLGRHDLEELCKLKMDDVLAGKYYPALLKNRVVTPEKSPKQSTFQFHVVNINTPVSTSSLSPRSDNHSPTYSRNDKMYLFLVCWLIVGESKRNQCLHHRSHPCRLLLMNDGDHPCYYPPQPKTSVLRFCHRVYLHEQPPIPTLANNSLKQTPYEHSN